MKIILSHFSPSTMPHDTLEAIFVQRESLARRITDLLRESGQTESKHHVLLVGPRGIGKTHLIALLYHRIRRITDLRQRLVIAWLREEEWGVTSFLDLLLRILRAICTEYDDSELLKHTQAVYGMPPQDAEKVAGALLKRYVGNRTLLILAENIGDCFRDLGESGQKRLRAYLQENAFAAIVATAQALDRTFSVQTAPFYGFFTVYYLEGLDRETATTLLINIARYNGDRELESFLKTPVGRARVRAVHHLAGGNHRVYVILSQFLNRGTLDQLVEPFMRTIDDLTPYYQARLLWLSPQQRKIAEFLSDQSRAVPVKEIAQHSFMTHQTASAQLKTMRQLSYVRSTAVGREVFYELNEPLMSLCMDIKKHRGEPIRLLVEFLRLWYSPIELQHHLSVLSPEAIIEREYLTHALKACERDTDPRAAACLRDFRAATERRNLSDALGAAEELVAVRGSAEDLVALASCLVEGDRLDEAKSFVDRAIEMTPQLAAAWFVRGLELHHRSRDEEALAAIDKALEIDSKFADAWNARGGSLAALGRHADALDAYAHASSLSHSNMNSLFGQIKSLAALEQFDRALSTSDELLRLDSENPWSWYVRSQTLLSLRRTDEALSSIDHAIAKSSNNEAAAFWLTRAYILTQHNELEQALVSVDKATDLGLTVPCVYFARAHVLLRLNRLEQAAQLLDRTLRRFRKEEACVLGHTAAIVQDLFATMPTSVWRPNIQALVEIYDRQQILSILGQSLVRDIPQLVSPQVSENSARTWRDLWFEVAGNSETLRIPLRLVDAALAYRSRPDTRMLLEISKEERELLASLLGDRRSRDSSETHGDKETTPTDVASE